MKIELSNAGKLNGIHEVVMTDGGVFNVFPGYPGEQITEYWLSDDFKVTKTVYLSSGRESVSCTQYSKMGYGYGKSKYIVKFIES